MLDEYDRDIKKKIEEEATNKIEEEIKSADDCVKSKGD